MLGRIHAVESQTVFGHDGGKSSALWDKRWGAASPAAEAHSFHIGSWQNT